jgi:hypothetical protein
MTKLITDRKYLESLPTLRLLAYKNKLLMFPEKPNWDDGEYSYHMNKSRPEWQNCYNMVKEILSSREHYENKRHR